MTLGRVRGLGEALAQPRVRRVVRGALVPHDGEPVAGNRQRRLAGDEAVADRLRASDEFPSAHAREALFAMRKLAGNE